MDSELPVYFNSVNLTNESSQEYVFLIMWHRKLNHKAIAINELINNLNDPRNGINSCYNIKRINAVQNFKRFQINQPIQLLFLIRSAYGIESTVNLGCPTIDWDHNITNNLLISGALIDKFYKSHPKGFYFRLKIIEISQNNVLYFFNLIQKGDTLEVDMNLYGRIIEPNYQHSN